MLRTSILFFLALFCTALSAQQATLPENFNDELVGSGWDRPVGITFAENGLGYVWEKAGRVMILDENGERRSEPLIDIREEIDNWSDLGLVGFALDPGFSTNGYFYLLYVVDRHYLDNFGTPNYDPNVSEDHVATIGRLTRYQADAASDFTTCDPATRKILLGESWEDGVAVVLGSHSVGSLVFGEDGTLLASFGDGGSYESIDRGDTPPTETYWAEAIAKGTLQPEDNVGALKSLQVQNYNGSIIRIDPETGLGLPSNPYYDASAPNSPQSKTWATGFRNPYRMILIPGTGSHNPANGDPGTLLIGDVGGSAWEELNVADRGGQCFGWPMFEGINYHWGFKNNPKQNPYASNPLGCSGNEYFTFEQLIKQPVLHGDPIFANPCNSNEPIAEDQIKFIHTPPAIAWSGLLWNPPPRVEVPRFDAITEELVIRQVDADNSPVNGNGRVFAGFTSIPGFVYDQEVFPEEYHGKYFHADLSGWIRVLTFNEGMEVTQVDTFAVFDDRGIAHMALSPFDGAIYWCNFYNSEIRRISFGGNPRPVVSATATPSYGPSPLLVQFDASESYDPNETDLTFEWEFGDGSVATGVAPQHEYTASGTAPESFEVLLTVTDQEGAKTTQKLLVSLNNTPPVVDITSVADDYRYPNNGVTILPLEASVTDAEHGDESLTYVWETFLHHNNHYHPNNPEAVQSTTLLVDPLGCDVEAYWYRARLTVTDGAGLSAYDEVEVFPNCDAPFFEVFNLNAAIDNNAVRLNWRSEFEEDLVEFVVERSADFNFSAIGQVPAAGSVATDYTFLDAAPIRGLNYYRLRGRNANGEERYSNVAAVDFNDRQFSVYPNPTNSELNIWMLEATSPFVEFEIVSPAGFIYYTNRWEAIEGEPFNKKILVNDLPAGFYFYRIRNGETTRAASFVVAR